MLGCILLPRGGCSLLDVLVCTASTAAVALLDEGKLSPSLSTTESIVSNKLQPRRSLLGHSTRSEDAGPGVKLSGFYSVAFLFKSL